MIGRLARETVSGTAERLGQLTHKAIDECAGDEVYLADMLFSDLIGSLVVRLTAQATKREEVILKSGQRRYY